MLASHRRSSQGGSATSSRPELPGLECHSLRGAVLVSSPAGLMSAYGDMLEPAGVHQHPAAPMPPAASRPGRPSPSAGSAATTGRVDRSWAGRTTGSARPALGRAAGPRRLRRTGAEPLGHRGHQRRPDGVRGATALPGLVQRRQLPGSRWPAARRRGARCAAARRAPPAARSGRPWRRKAPGRPRRTSRPPGRSRRRGSGRPPGARTGSAGSGWPP